MKVSTVAAGVAVLGLALTACGEAVTVSGRLDDVKMISAVKELSHRETKYVTVCTRRVKGVCKSSYDKPSGTKKVVDRAYKPAQYCVELDNVNGSSTRDDRWYNVSATTYNKYVNKGEGVKIKGMQYNHEGC